MRVKKKTTAALAIGGAGVLGLGLYVAVPAMANPSPSPSATNSAPAPDQRHRGKGPMGHPGFRGGPARFGGVHGEATVKRREGTGYRVVGWQRGQLTARSGAVLTVRSEDGAVWQWTTNGDTRVRKGREKAQVSSLATGDQVVVFGERVGTSRTAEVVRVPPKGR
jgi:hypothetical protein